MRHLGVWPDRGAVGDSAWRDGATGRLVTRDLDIPLPTLEARATELLGACGATIRRVAAGLAMPDWPEGTERALTFSLAGNASGGGQPNDEDGVERWLDSIRQADAYSYDEPEAD